MMQQVVLDAYFKRRGDVPLRKIAQDTGIQTSRIFRILNGSEMKVSEYEKFQRFLDKAESANSELSFMVRNSQKYLTPDMVHHLCNEVERLICKRKVMLGAMS